MRRNPPRAIEDPRLFAALALAAVFHGGLLAAGSFKRTYDAYIHIFFADHYDRSWFSTWEPRWYTGFTTTSYPPGTHQLIAVVSRIVGLEWAFVIVQLAAVLLLVVGVYRFARLWVSPAAAGWAALLATLSSSIAEVVHTFGQLPTTFSLALLLNSTPFVARWVTQGRGTDLLLATLCTAATTAGHHVTTLFGAVFFLGPVVVSALVGVFRTPLADEPPGHPHRLDRSNLLPLVARRLRRVAPALGRSVLYGVVVLVSLIVVVLPYWLWSSTDPITQIPIPHASRANFLVDRNAGLVFWLIPWGVLLVALPVALARGLASRAWPLAASVLLLTLLGTGGTTPLPRLLLGGAFEILTLDRFTFWATIAVLPLVGWFVDSLVRGRAAAFLRTNLSTIGLRAIQAVLALGLLAAAVFGANLASLRRFQPAAIDPGPIAAFLDKDQHSRWRYLTLGFGDQMAWLAANTTATSVDGNYHSARRLPELTSTPVERLEGAKYSGVPGIGSLQQFLAVPEKYHLKFVFSNDEFYDPLLTFSGWDRLRRLENGVVVWQREDVPPLPLELPSREVPGWQRLLWGIVPIASIGGAALGLLAAAAGVRLPARLRRRLARRARRAGLLGRGWGWVDARLRKAAARLADGQPGVRRWQTWRRWWSTAGALLQRRPSPRRRRGQLAAAVMLCLVPVAVGVHARPEVGPREMVIGYYDDLDFGRVASAYARLDPQTRPSLDQYLLERSVDDGLVASYGKLGRLDARVVWLEGDHARVEAHLDIVTSLASHRRVVVHDLVRVAGRWHLEPTTADATVPPDQLVRRTEVTYLSQGRRRVTTATTDYADVLDRPEVVTASARLVRAEGRWVVVGEVVNVDVDPADITITAQLLDANGKVLAQYNAAQIAVHKLLPTERTPFRVEFEGIAGSLDVRDPSAGPFDPAATTPLTIDDAAVATFAVYTKAVVATSGLDRSLVAQDLHVEQLRSGDWLVGSIRNDGTAEVTIPHLLLSYRDAAGALAWVDHAYLDRAVRPQRSTPFRVRLHRGDGIVPSGLLGATYDNGISTASARTAGGGALVPLGPGSAFAGLDLSVSGFSRSVTP